MKITLTKTQVISVACTLVAASFLAGCAESDQQTVTNKPGNQIPVTSTLDVKSTLEQTQVIGSSSSEENVTLPQIKESQVNESKTYSAEDMTTYNMAVTTGDASKCDKIVDSDYKNYCKSFISNVKITAEAVAKADDSLCEKSSDQTAKDNCKAEVQKQKVANIQASDSQNAMTADQKLQAEISKSGDYTRCKELSGTSAKFDCEVNILSQKQLETGDKSWCQKGSTQDVVKTCEQAATTK